METQTADLNKFHQSMEEELESIYPSDGDGSEGKEPEHWIDKERVKLFAEEFGYELDHADRRKWMFVMDVAMMTGESPKQLRRTVKETGIEGVFETRMAIHLMSKELNITYAEAGDDKQPAF